MHVTANGLQIEIDVQGPADGPPLLLIMGLGMPLVGWPEELVALLVQRGFRVIRLDNRDAGLSQGFEAYGVPSLTAASLRYLLHLRVRCAYTLADMAADALAVLDVLGIPTALLRRIQAPTRIIHGQADPLVPVAAAHDLQRKIAGASAEIIPGMGHDLPQALLPRLAGSLASHLQAAG